MSNTAAVILAAGASSRLGQPKQLLQLAGETLLARSVRLAREAGANPVVVVVGHQAARMHEALASAGAIIVINEEWASGMASSIRAGVEAAEQFAPGNLLLMVCDQPRLEAEHLRALLRAHQNEQQPATASRYAAGMLGVPAVFSRAMFAALKRLDGDRGARQLLQSMPCGHVEFEQGAVDIDLSEDLAVGQFGLVLR